ncbi:hypothetical protein RsTz2092_13130 [Deferribacterales bacterium RsTz2092]|nr:hypothetical protein AGMMS49941_12400 [Deferribacterales bacterium]
MHSFNVNAFFNRFRHLFFVLISLVAIVCIYALLSFVYVGRTDAVPLKWQKHLEISQKELYSNLDNFSIVGVDRNVLRSNSDNATIRVDVGDRVSEDYVRLSLVVARLNTTNHYPKGWLLQYTDRTGKQAERSFDFLQDGFNSSKLIKGGISAQFNVFSHNVMRGFSMELERAYLSKYPVLPNSFIAPFITFALFAVLIVWGCIYRGLHSWVWARNWALAVIIVIAQLLIVAHYRGQSNHFIGEEEEGYNYANMSEQDEQNIGYDFKSERYPLVKNAHGIWLYSQDVYSAFTAQPSEGLAHLNALRGKRAIHSPTHYIQLHLVSMLFPNTFNLWIGVLLNIPYYIGICLILYFMSKRFLRGRLALLPLIFYGFSNAAIHTVVFARSYTLATFFFTLLLYMAFTLLDKPNLSKRFYALLALISFLGYDSFLFFAVWLATIALIPSILLFKQRRFSDIIKCAIALLSGLVMYVSFIPNVLSILSENEHNMAVNVVMERILLVFQVFNNDFLGGALLWWLIIIIMLGSICIYRIKLCAQRATVNRDIMLKYLMMVTSVLIYMFVEAKYGQLKIIQSWHLLPVMPATVLLLTIVLMELVSKITANARVWQTFLTAIILILTLYGHYGDVKYKGLFPRVGSSINYATITESYRDTPVIDINDFFDVQLLKNLRQTIVIHHNDKQALQNALTDIDSDEQLILCCDNYYTTKYSMTSAEVQAVFDVVHQRGYKQQMPFLGGNACWLFMRPSI